MNHRTPAAGEVVTVTGRVLRVRPDALAGGTVVEVHVPDEPPPVGQENRPTATPRANRPSVHLDPHRP